MNIQNKKSYIGSSRSCLKRMQIHRYHLRKNSNKNPYLQEDWNTHREDDFVFRIIEHLNSSLTKEEFEEYETKWVLHFKSNLSEFGYNITLPGNIRQKKEEGVNTGCRELTEYVCINIPSKEITILSGRQLVADITSISFNKIEDLANHWKGKTKRKSLHGWMIVKKEDYDPAFDYVNYKKERVLKYGTKRTWRDYPSKYVKKSPEEYIKREDRNLKRVSIVAHNILTGEDTVYPMLKSCYKEFSPIKVRKCINAPFGKYKHRGHYFRRIDVLM